MMIRPLVMQISVIVLFMLPMVTMRTYAEEKRSGTIELLLTAPLTDVQIILGKFLGALGLYAAMLLVDRRRACSSCSPTATPTGSRSRPRYLGLLLLGASFIALGLFISSLTQNQIVAGVLTFVLLLMLLLVGWLRDFITSPAALDGGLGARRSSSTSTTSPRASSTPSTSPITSASSPSACS